MYVTRSPKAKLHVVRNTKYLPDVYQQNYRGIMVVNFKLYSDCGGFTSEVLIPFLVKVPMCFKFWFGNVVITYTLISMLYMSVCGDTCRCLLTSSSALKSALIVGQKSRVE